jgi:hypothetical protein
MPDSNGQPLPPIEDEAFVHGVKEQVELVENKCTHKSIKQVSSLEARCSCGAGWTGVGISQLVTALTSQ